MTRGAPAAPSPATLEPARAFVDGSDGLAIREHAHPGGYRIDSVLFSLLPGELIELTS